MAVATENTPTTVLTAVCLPERLLKRQMHELPDNVRTIVQHPDFIALAQQVKQFAGWYRIDANGKLHYVGKVQIRPLATVLAVYCQRICNLKRHTGEAQKAMCDAVEEEALRLVREHMPSGSGFDNGTKLLLPDPLKVRSGKQVDKLVFNTSFHHMNDNGMYTGWTNHSVIVQPDWSGLSVQVTGRDTNGIKEFIGEVFDQALHMPVEVEA